MSESPVVAVTGATGALGSLVAELVADLGPRLLVRDPDRLPAALAGPADRVRTCTYADTDAVARALESVDVVLMVSAAESADRRAEHRSFVEGAVRAGVGHLVYTSFAGADPDATFTLGRDHFDTEQALAASGLATTVLRDNFYLDVLPLFADDDGVIAGPAGTGRVAAVARLDVAEVAAAVLRAPADHHGATYTLTGAEALGLDEVAARSPAALGRALTYAPQSLEEAYATRRAAYPDAPDWQLDAWVSTYTAIADGSVADVTDDVRRLTGHPPRTLEQTLTT